MSDDAGEEMKSDVRAAYTLTGADLDPDYVTAFVGITPSDTWRAGHLIDQRAGVRYKHSGWSIQSNLPASTALEDQVKNVLEQLRPAWPALVELGTRYHSEIECVVRSYGGDRPPIHFEQAEIKRIAELDADIDVDFFIF